TWPPTNCTAPRGRARTARWEPWWKGSGICGRSAAGWWWSPTRSLPAGGTTPRAPRPICSCWRTPTGPWRPWATTAARWPAGCPSTTREQNHELGTLESPGRPPQGAGRAEDRPCRRPCREDPAAGRAADGGGNAGGGLWDVFGCAGASAGLERKEHALRPVRLHPGGGDRKSTRLNSSQVSSSYAVFCLT